MKVIFTIFFKFWPTEAYGWWEAYAVAGSHHLELGQVDIIWKSMLFLAANIEAQFHMLGSVIIHSFLSELKQHSLECILMYTALQEFTTFWCAAPKSLSTFHNLRAGWNKRPCFWCDAMRVSKALLLNKLNIFPTTLCSWRFTWCKSFGL